MSEMHPEKPEPDLTLPTALGDIPIFVDGAPCSCIHVLVRTSATSWHGSRRIADPDCEVHP